MADTFTDTVQGACLSKFEFRGNPAICCILQEFDMERLRTTETSHSRHNLRILSAQSERDRSNGKKSDRIFLASSERSSASHRKADLCHPSYAIPISRASFSRRRNDLCMPWHHKQCESDKMSLLRRKPPEQSLTSSSSVSPITHWTQG